MSTGELLISADDHVEMTHDQVKLHLPKRFYDDYDAGVGAYLTSMKKARAASVNQQWRAGRGNGDNTTGGTTSLGRRSHPAAGRPGHMSAADRLADMDQDGVAASITYSEVSAFRYLYLMKEGWREATRAFNVALGEWASVDPSRLIVSYQIPIHDIEAAVAEVRWAASTGCRSLQLPVFPNELGLPDYWDSRYQPLFAAIQDCDLPICLHIGLNTSLDDLARRDPTPQGGIFVPMVPLSTAEQLGMWIMGGVFERFSRLRVVFVEPGIGWVAWWLHTVDDMASRQGYEYPAIRHLPSRYFHQNVFLTFIDEPNVVRHAREVLGVSNVMWSSDYPHPVSSWPDSVAIVGEMLQDTDPHERELILSGNASRVWQL